MASPARTYATDLGQSAIGMVRAYGRAAEAEAMACARKFEKSNDRLGFENWTAIATLIRRGAETSPVEKSLSGTS